MGDKEDIEKWLNGIRKLDYYVNAVDEQEPIILGEIIKSELMADDIEIPKVKETEPIEFTVSAADFKIGDLINKPALPINSIYAVFVQARPHTKRIVNYQAYEYRWRKATSLRKAKKYAKILGYNKTHNERYTFWPLPYGLYIPQAEIQSSVDLNNKTSNINIKALNNE